MARLWCVVVCYRHFIDKYVMSYINNACFSSAVGYKKGIDGYNYKYHEGGKTWNDAQKTCQTEGGHLAIVWDSTTQSVVKAFMKRGWIGATDQYEETRWQTPMKEDLPYSNWAPGEPNNYGKGEDCAALRDNGQWDDYPCHHKKTFLCQYIPGMIIQNIFFEFHLFFWRNQLIKIN